MNEGKRGRPFLFPESLVRFAVMLRTALRLPFRQLQGILDALAGFLAIKVPDYTTLWHRLCRCQVHFPRPNLTGSEWTLAIDSTGIKVSDRGEWMREKWHVHRGWIKVHMAVEVVSGAIVGIQVSDEGSPDAPFLPGLVEQAAGLLPGRIARVTADGAYDTFENFDFLASRGIDPAIKLRKNASMKCRGNSFARPKAVRELRALGEEEWKRRHQYNMRWKSETGFSAVKRRVGEAVRSKRPDLALKEAETMFVQYAIMRDGGLR
ncbi:MAG TPA: IS5 family transposase, partial [Methanomassiliicoccales archaeon]|nr:IS5 family transposase [Methanomassiliicoccales archaeon]